MIHESHKNEKAEAGGQHGKTHPAKREESSWPAGNVASSSSSVKTKKSSNIFSALVRRARRAKKPSSKNPVEIKSVQSQNYSAASTLSLATHLEEEVELSCQNYEKKCSQTHEMLWENKGMRSDSNSTHHSDGSTVKTKKNPLDVHESRSYVQLFRNEKAQADYSQPGIEPKSRYEEESMVITSFVDFAKPTLNVTNADALLYLQNVLNGLQESESHIVHLLTKYITDSDVQSEMRNALTNHAKLQWEAEKRSCSLANDIWMQQLEIGKAQEKIFQSTMQSLVKQNRQLQILNEALYRKFEKANRLSKCAEHKNRYSVIADSDAQIESMLRHNEKLQTKLETFHRKIESLEAELLIFQKQNDNMEDQLRDYTDKFQDMKALLHKMKTDYEIEQVSLTYKLTSKEQLLKEALEVGEVVLEDLDVLKQELKHLPVGLDLSKFQIKGNCLSDLLHICRTCINELFKDLVNMHTENSQKDKDILALREANRLLQGNFKRSLAELDNMSKKTEQFSTLLEENDTLRDKCVQLEKEVKTKEDEIEAIQKSFDEEKTKLMQSAMGYDKYIKELEEKEKMIEQTKLFVANITSENYSLQNEIMALNRIINETGAGDIVREIEHQHDELEDFKYALNKINQEKGQLKAELEAARSESATLTSNQELVYKTLQRQVKEMARLNEEIQQLRRKIEVEQQTVTSLQHERVKYLEEKTLLKSVIQHLKNEISKVRQLEDNLTNASKKASKLELIAESSKQETARLQQEIQQREHVIDQMKDSLHKLNEIQMENTKEKLSLYHELNEVSQLKDKLSKVLNTEVKKNVVLGQSKEAIVKSVNTQMQKIEEKHKTERSAIRLLLNDIKHAEETKGNVLQEKCQLQTEMERLKQTIADHEQRETSIVKELNLKSQEVKELRKEIDQYEKQHKDTKEKLEKESSKYEINVKQLRKLIEQLRDEKRRLENSNDYLKKNMEKLQKDLNESRQTEKSTNDMLNRIQQDQEETKRTTAEQAQEIKNLLKEKDKITEEKYQLISEKNGLIKETGYLNTLMDKIIIDFENNMKTAEEKENTYKTELDEIRQVMNKVEKENKDLNESILIKNNRIETLEDVIKTEKLREKRYNKLKEEISQLEKEHSSLKDTKNRLEVELADLQEEYKKLNGHVISLERELEMLESQLKVILDQKEEDYLFYKKHIAEISKTKEEVEDQHRKELGKLRTQIQEISGKFENEKTAYATLTEIHKDVSTKLMRCLKELVDTKNSKQNIIDKIKNDTLSLDQLAREKKQLELELREQSEHIEKANRRIYQLTKDKETLENECTTAVNKCATLERRIIELDADHHHKSQSMTEATYSKSEIDNLKGELEEQFATIHRQKLEISDLQNQITLLELEKSEIALELHNTKKKLETEKSLAEQLKNTQKLLLAAVVQLRDEGKMDSLSSDQLKSYEQLIDQIQLEHERRESLEREIEKVTNELIISNLSKLNIDTKIAHITVKIFTDIVEMFSLYGDELTTNIWKFSECEQCKFYLIELYLTEALVKKLRHIKWALNISIRTDGGSSVNKTTPIDSTANDEYFVQVLALDYRIVNSEVCATLLLTSSETDFVSLCLDKVSIDISYHFEMRQKSVHRHLSSGVIEKRALQLTKLHSPELDIDAMSKQPSRKEERFATSLTAKQFAELLIRHCYHKVDVELLSELTTESNNAFIIHLYTYPGKHSIGYDKETKRVTIKSNAKDMEALKKYFGLPELLGNKTVNEIAGPSKEKKNEEIDKILAKWS